MVCLVLLLELGRNRSKQFSPELKPVFASIYKNALLDADPGVIGIIASCLADSTLDYKSVITDYSFLQEAKDKLNLPKDYEAIQPLDEAMAYFEEVAANFGSTDAGKKSKSRLAKLKK